MCAHFLRFDVRSTLLIFSFNDTATTEIYTLSLHDALPISGWATSFVNGGTCTQGSNWTTVTNMVATSPNAAFHNDPTCVTDNYLVSPSINITSGTAVDRKSTRLNSSHANISYAVFCLKKKI